MIFALKRSYLLLFILSLYLYMEALIMIKNVSEAFSRRIIMKKA